MSLFGPKQPIGSTQEALKFAEIHNDTIILKDGNLRQVLLCSSINFALKSEQEQNAIVFAYQNFINSLSFPIQILMQSKKLDLGNYLAKLTERASGQTNELLRAQTLDYIDFIKRLINLANIMDKRFYVVIPYLVPPKIEPLKNPIPSQKAPPPLLSAEEFETFQKELEQRVQVVESGLGTIGIRTAKLNTQQIIELLYGVYNPEESAKEKLTEAGNLTGEVVQSALLQSEEAEESKEEGNAPKQPATT
ncbi:MAG TPA: TraC family protein [Patescibacteria group bacterium]|nr:TraC family protein [Patescibacteria group bacterium]